MDNGAKDMILCLDIGGSWIKAAVAERPGELRPVGRRPTPIDDFDSFVATIQTLLPSGLEQALPVVAISVTGVVDPETGIIRCANIPCIDGKPLEAELGRQLSRRVIVANDADCFALAEAVEGVGRGHRIVFGAILGTGVGGGLVIDRRIVVGAGGYAGEWGHGPIAATLAGNPPRAIPRFPCGCGLAGCVDTIGGARGMERLHQHLHGIDLDSVEIVARWRGGDAAAGLTIDCFAQLVAGPLARVVNVVGAGIVPVGGGLGTSDALVARLDGEVRRRILRRSDKSLLVPGTRSIEPGLLGAAILAFKEGGK